MMGMSGITIDGVYVENGNILQDGSDQLVCGLTSDGGIVECAQAQPDEFIQRNWMESLDFDSALFANYGKDWWLGILYRPARTGLMGPTARQNVTEAGDFIWEVLVSAYENRQAIRKLLVLMFRMGIGSDDFERRMETCIQTNAPDFLEDFQRLDQIAEQRMREAAGNMTRRMAGGVFVNYTTGGGRWGRRILSGGPATTRHVAKLRIPFNFIAASWGAMVRVYLEYKFPDVVRTPYATSQAAPRVPNILNLFSGMLVGEGRTLDFLYGQDWEQMLLTAGTCIADDDEDLEAFSVLIDSMINFHEDRR